MELKCTLIVFVFFLPSSESHGCGDGFIKTNKSCEDENECEAPNLCGKNAQCVNTNGSYYCTCDEGFQSIPPNFTASTDGQCVDINECIEKTHTCPRDRECENTIGSYNCKCPKGYRREQRLDSLCEDVDECVSSVCGVHSSCMNTPGSFSCICSPGFDKHENNTCTDIDECKDPDPDVCGTNAVCINHPGSFICECHEGYSNYGNNQSKCTDISQMHFCV